MLQYCTYGIRNYNTKSIEIHVRHYFEFQIITKGVCYPSFRKEGYNAESKGNFWVFRPDCPHGWKEVYNKTCEVVVFHFPEVSDTLRQVLQNKMAISVTISEHDIEKIKKLAKELKPEMTNPGPLSQLKSRLCLDTLSLIFLEELSNTQDLLNPSREKQITDIAIAWFCSHMDECPDILRVASIIGYDVSHLRRIFHKATGESPNKILTKYRMVRAAEMLISGNEQIISISLMCGYNSHCAFTRAFKKYYNISPLEFRDKNLPNYSEYLKSLL